MSAQPQWRCLVSGCRIYGQWQPAATGEEADRKGHSHYLAEHYQPAHT